MTVPGGAGSPDPVWTEPQGLNQTRGRWSLWGVGATNQPERAAQLAQWRAGWGAFRGSPAATRKGCCRPTQRLTGCPGSVITVLMLSILKVQYCDN